MIQFGDIYDPKQNTLWIKKSLKFRNFDHRGGLYNLSSLMRELNPPKIFFNYLLLPKNIWFTIGFVGAFEGCGAYEFQVTFHVNYRKISLLMLNWFFLRKLI